MNDFKYDLVRLAGVNSPAKTLIVINGNVICFANSNSAAKTVIKYASTLDEAVLSNGKIKRLVKKALGVIL